MKDCCLADADTGTASLFKALSHPVRLAILRALADGGEKCCGDLVCELPLAQSTVSQHLKILKEAGLVKDDAHGPKSNYRVEAVRLRELLNDVSRLLDTLEETPGEHLATEQQPA